MTCENKLSKNFIRKCGYKPKAGLESEVYLLNIGDIDKATSQLSESKMSITSLMLAATGKLYKAEGAGRYPQGNTSMAQGDNGPDWTHGIVVRLLYYGETERAELQRMVDGGRIAAIVKKRDKGEAGELAFDVLGWESGMEVQSVEWNSNENEGVVTVTLATVEGEYESTDRKIFVDTDLAGTEEWITTNLYTEEPQA